MSKYFGKKSVFNDTAYRNYFIIENTMHYNEDNHPESIADIDEWFDHPEDIHKTINWGNALLMQTKYSLWGRLKYIFGGYRTVCFTELVQYNSPYETSTIGPDEFFGLMILDEINKRRDDIAYTVNALFSNDIFKDLVDAVPGVSYPNNYRPGVVVLTIREKYLKKFITAYQRAVKALPFQEVSNYMRIASVAAVALASQNKSEKHPIFWWSDPAYENPFELTFATRSTTDPITEVKIIHNGGLNYIIETPRSLYDKLFKKTDPAD